MQSPFLAATLATEVTRDRIEAAADHKAATRARREPRSAPPSADGLLIRRADADDAIALEQLGVLDGDRGAGRLLARLARRRGVIVAEVDGELQAALAFQGLVAVADPFRRTAAMAALLVERARQMTADARPAGSTGLRLGALRTRLH